MKNYEIRVTSAERQGWKNRQSGSFFEKLLDNIFKMGYIQDNLYSPTLEHFILIPVNDWVQHGQFIDDIFVEVDIL
jgi:hypothetical protein